MLLPQALLHLRHSARPMTGTPVARAVADATTRLLGDRAGITTLLANDALWVEGFEAFVQIVQATLPGDLKAPSARRVAASTPGLYVPGVGTFINAPLLAGRTEISREDGLVDQAVAGQVALTLAHETAGHAYMAENTQLGLRQTLAGSWQQAVAFAGAVARIPQSAAEADQSVLCLCGQVIILAEGWARWVTRKLSPLLAESLPGAAQAILHDGHSEAQMADDETARRLMADLLSHPSAAEAAFERIAAGEGEATPHGVGLALFEALEHKVGAAGCIETLYEACRLAPSRRPDVFLLSCIGS